MATDAQIIANRLNAAHSCGPKSEESKAKVSQNRRTHGLCGSFGILAWERREQYDELLAAMIEAEQPANASETELVVKMAQHTWRANRALRLQDACFEKSDPFEVEVLEDHAGVSINPLNLETAMRYHTMHDRAYQRAEKQLMERRKQRQSAEIGFERKKALEAEAERKKAQTDREKQQAEYRKVEAERKAERHQAALATSKLENQLLEMRVAKSLVAQLSRNTPSPAAQSRDFGITQAAVAA